MKSIPIAIVGVVVMVLAAGGYLLHRAEAGVNKIALSEEPKGVTVVAAKATTYRDRRRYIGTLEAYLDAKVGPQLASGYVGTVLVRPGAVVKRNDVVATIDCRNASAANQAVSMQARALQEREKAASREVARMSELLDGGYASPNEVELKQAGAAAEAAQIQSLLAQASGKSLEVSDCVLRAPFDGEVAARFVDPGWFVKPGAPVVEIVDRSVVRLTADVPEIDFEAVGAGTAVKFHVLATNQDLEGTIVRRAPAADPSTRTIHFEVELENAKRDIPVGTTAEIFVDVGKPAPATEIPLLAGTIRGDKASLFVIKDNVAEKKSVKVLGELGASIYIDPKDLAAGARVVTQGKSLLANNDRVTAKLEGDAK
ncbi:MAG: efflux RND transporter periplasmic adaptor subunit [Labilithrix sp.]